MDAKSAITLEPITETANRAVSGSVTFLFAICSFLSAALLFLVQLIVSKYILPWFGGSAAVWTTSMLVFQLLLLAGYLYAHLLAKIPSRNTQVKVHVCLLSIATLLVILLSIFWPSAITPSVAWRPAANSNPAFEVACIILVSAGVPFFVLSTTGPLLQSWFARLGGGSRTYKLYSISNVGSLIGLSTYPFLIEPMLRMGHQGQIWSTLFCAFAIGCTLCGWLALKNQQAESAPVEQSEAAVAAPREERRSANVLWFFLAFCASALLLATTNLLCEEVTTVPLLWVLPLSLYLLSFIICFDHARWYRREIFHSLFAVCVFITCAALLASNAIWELICVPVLLFLTCMICHGELVRLKPGVKRLTSFYLAISVGGAAGGIFVGVIAPNVFSSFVEFQLSLGLAVVLTVVMLLLDDKSWLFQRSFWLPAAITAGALATGYACSAWFPEASTLLNSLRFYPLALLLGTVTVAGAFIMHGRDGGGGRQFAFAQVLVVGIAFLSFAALFKTSEPKPGLVLSKRNFYGVVRVFRQFESNALVHGTITHGTQFDPPMNRYPTTYYGAQSGIGVLLQNHPKRVSASGNISVGVVGLGAGTLATYGRQGDSIQYYEINPDVVNLSLGMNPVFTYIRDSAAKVNVTLGDARLSLEGELRGKPEKYDVLVLDAFSGDAVPVHLLTKEAFDSYWQRVDPETGVIAVHVTSRHVNLIPVVEAISKRFDSDFLIAYNQRSGPVFESCWILLSRQKGLLRTIPGMQQIAVIPSDAKTPVLWTDDYSNIFNLIRW